MTTARDVIAARILRLFQVSEDDASLVAFGVLSDLLSAPDSIRLELAAQLNPWREGPPPEDADTEATENGHWWRHLLPGAPPSEDK